MDLSTWANRFKPRNLILIRELAIVDFKLRYQGSVLGYVWSLLKPLLTFTVLYVVFTRILQMGQGIPHYAIDLLLGVVVWTFFTEATATGLHSLVAKGDLIRKVNIPKFPIVLSAVFSAFINFMLNLLVVFAFALLTKSKISGAGICLFPLVVVELLLFSIPIAFVLAALFVKYRDIAYIWDAIIQVMFYATPIIYPLSMVSKKMVQIIALNPMAQIIQSARWLLVAGEPAAQVAVYSNKLFEYLIPLALIGVINIFAIWYFQKRSKTFAENL